MEAPTPGSLLYRCPDLRFATTGVPRTVLSADSREGVREFGHWRLKFMDHWL